MFLEAGFYRAILIRNPWAQPFDIWLAVFFRVCNSAMDVAEYAEDA
ncbi:MAG: hypothetical protein ACI92Z_000806 [Paracoccaceae bacterium]|jgi:hypothetical protein